MAADLLGLAAAIGLVAGLTGIPGFILAARGHDTRPRGRPGDAAALTEEMIGVWGLVPTFMPRLAGALRVVGGSARG
jgi:uncharacterized membrane protein